MVGFANFDAVGQVGEGFSGIAGDAQIRLHEVKTCRGMMLKAGPPQTIVASEMDRIRSMTLLVMGNCHCGST